MKSDVDVEVDIEPLAEEDLRRAIPCEAIPGRWVGLRAARFDWRTEKPCGRPSVARVRVRCGACSAEYRLFLCRWCSWRFRFGLLVACRACNRTGRLVSRRS